MSSLKLLNLGCGNHFYDDWINYDFVSNSEHVIQHDLLNGIPISDENVDVVYHSHVLEHLNKEDGVQFIGECYRVLKKGGVIRVVIPDLEAIVKEYLKYLELSVSGDSNAKDNYNWIMLELFDQTVRNSIGGHMISYLHQLNIPNEKYVYSRIGVEGKNMRDSYLASKSKEVKVIPESKTPRKILKKIIKRLLYRKKSHSLNDNEIKALRVGEFRLSGEIHQWMYDRHSLSELLKICGFDEVRTCSSYDSSIPSWSECNLDVSNGEVRKPDSLFMEARKK